MGEEQPQESQTRVLTQKAAQALPPSVLLRMPQGVGSSLAMPTTVTAVPGLSPAPHPAEQGVICCADSE